MVQSASVLIVDPFQAHRGELFSSVGLFFCSFSVQIPCSPPVGSEEAPRIGGTHYDGFAEGTNQNLAFTGHRLCKNR